MGIFDNTLGGQTKQKPKGGGIFANTISRQRPQQQYHASVDSRGTSLGFSDERDTSGRPFFAYRNPGDTSTTTDYKRVATQFDPRIATTTPRDSFYNPRDPRIGDSDKRTQIDHEMALALSGSNNPANLRTVPNAQNRDSGIIRDLQGNVIAGRNSLFQAQSDLAIEKKTPLPFTGSRYGQFALEAKQAQEEARKAQSFGGLFKNTLSDLKSRFTNLGQKVSEAVPGVRAIADMGVQGSFEPIIKHASTIGTKEHQERLLGKKDHPIKNKEGKTLGYTYSPKNQMNFALGFVNPVGGEGTVLDKIAKEKSFSVIKNLLKKIGDYSDDVVEKLVRTDTVDEVTSILRSNITIRQGTTNWSKLQKENPDLFDTGILRKNQKPQNANGVIPVEVHTAQTKWQNYGQDSEVSASILYGKDKKYGGYIKKDGDPVRDSSGNILDDIYDEATGRYIEPTVSNKHLRDNLLDSFSTKEGKQYLKEVVNALPKNSDGTITAYRIGAISKEGTQSYTLSEGMAKTFSNQGTVILPAGTPGLPKGGYKDFGALPANTVKIKPEGIVAWSPYDAEILVESKYVKTTSQLRTEYADELAKSKSANLPKANSAQQAVKDGLTEEQFMKGQGTPKDGLTEYKGAVDAVKKDFPNEAIDLDSPSGVNDFMELLDNSETADNLGISTEILTEKLLNRVTKLKEAGSTKLVNKLGEKLTSINQNYIDRIKSDGVRISENSGSEKVKLLRDIYGGTIPREIKIYRGTNLMNAPLRVGDYVTPSKSLARGYVDGEFGNVANYTVKSEDLILMRVNSGGIDSVEMVYLPKAQLADLQIKTTSQLRADYQTAKGLSKPSPDFIGEPKKSGKQLAKEEVDNMFAERERKVAREYVERKTTNRAEYDPGYFARKETLENNLKTTRQIEKQTKPPQTSQQSSQTIPNSKASVGRTMSEGEAKSIEIQAKQAIDIMAGGKIPDGVSLHKIISDTVTPVTKKVNFIDTFLRTPDRVMNKIGFGKEAVELRRAMDSYWKELPKNIAKHTEWAKRVPKESNERIFKYLDGQAIDLRPDEKQVALEIRAWLEQWADRLKLPKSQRVSEYITRLFDEELLAKEFPEELAKIIADKVPGSVYNPFMLRRLGAKGYKQDTWAALDAYVKRATRKVHMDPVLEKIQAKTGQSLEMANIEKSQFKYVQRYVENINMRPSEIEESIDNFLKSSPLGYKFGQRPVASISQFLRRISFRAGLGLNLGSALRNLSQGANTYSELGEKYTTLGYVGLFKKGAKEELEREGVLNAGFIQDRVLSSTAKIIERMDKGLFAMFQVAEYINRGAAYFGAKSKALSAGKSIDEAIEYAKGIVRKTQFSFDSVDTPVGMSSNIAKTVMQFQTFTMKQMEFLGEKAKGSVTGKEKVKNVIGLLRYAAAGTVFVYTIGRAFGMEPRELIPIYRIGAPPALVPIVETGKAALDTPDKYGNQRELKTKAIDVGKSFLGYVPAGSQIKKSFLGDQAVRQGGSFDKGGNLQFKVGETTGQKIQARLFGKYAGPQSDKYFNRAEEAQKLNKEAERTYDELLALPKSEGDHRFTQLEKDNPKLADKLKTIGRDRKLGITEKDRELRAFGVTNGDRAQRVLDYILELPSEADQDKLYDELVKKKIITSVVAKQIKELMQSR